MDFKSIDNKRIQGDKLRLTEPTVLFPEGTATIKEHEVTSDEICRIDMISRIYYNDDSFSENILKFNNISNPFSINEGDILRIPDKVTMVNWQQVKNIGEESTEKSIKDQFIDSKRLTIKDISRAEYLKKKASQKENGSKQILPPNILKDGDTNIDINGNTIII